MVSDNNREVLEENVSMPELSASAKSVFLPLPLFCFLAVLLIVSFVSSARYLWLVNVNHAQFVPVFILPNSPAVYHGDFTLFARAFHHFRGASFWSDLSLFNYPATTALPIEFFYKFPHPVKAYLSFLSLLIVAGAWLWAVRLKQRGISEGAAALFVIAFLVSYPFRFELQRANIEGVVVLFTGGAILALLRRRYWIAATLIGIAAAMKIFPIILLGLLFSARKYRQMVWGLGVAVAANIFSLWLLGPSIAIANKQVAHGMAMFQSIYVDSDDRSRLFCDHSLFTLVKLPLLRFGGANAAHLVHAASSIYLAAVAFTGLVLFFFLIRKLPFLNQTLILTLCAVSLPPVSFDYTLLHLAVPFALLSLYASGAWNGGETSPTTVNVVMGLFGLIFADLNFFGLHGQFMGPLRAIAIIALLITLLRHPLHWRTFQQA